MAAYIVGMITGTVCLILPLVYMMHTNRCVADLYAQDQVANVQQFIEYTHTGLAYLVGLIGAVVLVVSTALVAVTGFVRLRKLGRGTAGAVRPEAAPEEPPDLTVPDAS